MLLIGGGYWPLYCSRSEWAICFDLICGYSAITTYYYYCLIMQTIFKRISAQHSTTVLFRTEYATNRHKIIKLRNNQRCPPLNDINKNHTHAHRCVKMFFDTIITVRDNRKRHVCRSYVYRLYSLFEHSSNVETTYVFSDRFQVCFVRKMAFE